MSLRRRNININITDFCSVFITKARKYCIPYDGVDINNICDICNYTASHGATTIPNWNSIIPTPTNQLRHK